MPTITSIAAFDDESEDHGHRRDKKNHQVRGVRRETRRDSQARASARSRRGRERHLSVRGELREQPDLRKIARAVIQLALAQAEAEAQAARNATDSPEGGSDA